MGSQRRMAENLMEHFMLTEDEAYEKAHLIEAVGGSVGDDLSDALIPLTEHGDVKESIRQLGEIALRLAAGVTTLTHAFEDVRKRRR